MQLGAFSVSLSVRDLPASRSFYEALGFSVTGGEPAQNWLVMRNNGVVIGLFQGMFEGNLLTFNPGWDQHSRNCPTSRMYVNCRRNWMRRALNWRCVPTLMGGAPATCSWPIPTAM